MRIRRDFKIFLNKPYIALTSMRGSRSFCQGGSRSIWQKALTSFFLVLSLFYWSQMVNFEENCHFPRFQRGSNIFQGGVGGAQLFPRGSNCLFPIETHLTCDFPGGSGPPVPPPSGSPLDKWIVAVQCNILIGIFWLVIFALCLKCSEYIYLCTDVTSSSWMLKQFWEVGRDVPGYFSSG